MSEPQATPPPRLVHPALEPTANAVPLEAARLTDQARLAVLLQAAALLAHADSAGLLLGPDGSALGWDQARIDGEGLLRLSDLRPGRALMPAQILLADLLRRLFRSESDIAGRGMARRAARQLLGLWQQELITIPADRVVEQLLDIAPFLWEKAFASARRALAAQVDGQLRVALSFSVGHRFVSGGMDLEGLQDLLASESGHALRTGSEVGDPRALIATGQLDRAVAAWRLRGMHGREHEDCAETLLALGYFSRALETLSSRTNPRALLCKARCQHELGQRNAALLTLRKLESEPDLAEDLELGTAEVMVRLLAGRGQAEEVRERVKRLLGRTFTGLGRLEALIVAAGAAWDCGDSAAMDHYLEESRSAASDARLGPRWHHAAALRAFDRADSMAALDHMRRTFTGRRRRGRHEVARLWNDMAVARVLADDLAGAERASRHAFRAFSRGEGQARATLALTNLAEIRLRRGFFAGVLPTLERSIQENRRSGNFRGLARDLELWARFELAQGRATAALARCSEALTPLRRSEAGGEPSAVASAVRAPVFEVFAARAWGWLERPEAAGEALDRGGAVALTELDPEERPAVWALARRPESARGVAQGSLFEGLWQSLLDDLEPSLEAWSAFERLEPFRAARLVFDVEKFRTGVVPTALLARAIAVLRRAEADRLAAFLEMRLGGPWAALKDFAEQDADDDQAWLTLLEATVAGPFHVLETRNGATSTLFGRPSSLLTRTLQSDCAETRLELQVRTIDPMIEAVFALLARDRRRQKKALDPAPTDFESEDRAHADDPEPGRADGIFGRSPALRATLERLDRLAPGEMPVLILGESGCGKESLARRAHRLSSRGKGPFLALNCAALAESLIQSELFGHVRGAFTGADRDRPGIFEAARGGTVFLDEIGDLPLASQGHLLRVLQEGEIRRVGESFTRKVDVRIIAATHRELEDMVQSATFRQDLFFRLKVARVVLPPLRQRGGDILLLAEHFLKKKPGRGLDIALSRAARERLLAHDWPGNIRELKNVLEVAAALARDFRIEPEDLDLPRLAASPVARENAASFAESGDYHQKIEAFRKQILVEAIGQASGNRAEAARRLGLSRQALSYLVKQLDLF